MPSPAAKILYIKGVNVLKEEWRRLIYQGKDYGNWYEVYNYGEIRNSKTKKVRKKNILKTGYYFVSGSLGSRKNKITFKVHKAVAETFINNLNNFPIINHKDGNKLNNRIDNLEWCTAQYNVQHAFDNGLILIRCGKDASNTKLTLDDVKYIRKNYIPRDYEFGTRGLARKFNVSHQTIIRALKNKSWII